MNFRHKSLHFRHSKRPSPYTHKTSLLSTSAFSHDAITQKGKSSRVRNTYICSNQKRKNYWKNNTNLVPFPQPGKFYLNARVMSANPVVLTFRQGCTRGYRVVWPHIRIAYICPERIASKTPRDWRNKKVKRTPFFMCAT